MTRCAASAIVCIPEEQNRFTVIPDVVIGQPARIAIWRAMFQPVAPSGFAQPMITSSTSAASSLARSMACLTAWPPIVAPWVMLSAPRQDLQSGVRAVETITASVMEDLPGGRARGRGCAVGTPGIIREPPRIRKPRPRARGRAPLRGRRSGAARDRPGESAERLPFARQADEEGGGLP